MRTPAFLVVLVIFAVGQLHGAEETPGAALFAHYCSPCHGADGRARTPAARKLGVKDLAESRLSDAEIIRQITDGRKDERGKERMPAFKEKLTPAEIAALGPFVRALRR